jgi:molecular chaperone DnaK (HSP70)
MDTTGTTNSAVAIMEGKVPKIIENSEGKHGLYLSSAGRMLTLVFHQVPEQHLQ